MLFPASLMNIPNSKVCLKGEWSISYKLPLVIQKYTKFANFARLYIFHILQRFATKLCNFTNFTMLFNTAVMNFPISTFFKILFIMEMVRSRKTKTMIFSAYQLASSRRLNEHQINISVCSISLDRTSTGQLLGTELQKNFKL